MTARPEYQALVDFYPEILRDFEVTLSANDQRDLGVLMTAIEHTDRVLDGLSREAERRGLAGGIVALLHTGHERPGGAFGAAIDPTLAVSIRALRGVAVQRGVGIELARRTAETFANSEAMRTAQDRERYFACIEREAMLCMELALLIVPLPEAPAAFLRAIAGPANYLDKLIDLRRDHARGEAIVDPGIRTHLALAGRMLRGAVTAWPLHPSKRAAARWGIGWVGRMLR
jgi:hypothetical protein